MADKTTRRASRRRRVKKDVQHSFPAKLDRLIHERIRLGIVSALAAGGRMSFKELKRLLDTTDGNLSVHARKLEDAGYIRTVKSFEDRTPKTEFELLDKGRAALQNYLDQMERIIQIARDSAS